MTRKRFIIEVGYGTDLHGGDMTKAARRAVRIGCSRPEQVDARAVLEMIPFGSRELELVPGGLSVRGLDLPELGEGDSIIVAVAALTVSVDRD